MASLLSSLESVTVQKKFLTLILLMSFLFFAVSAAKTPGEVIETGIEKVRIRALPCCNREECTQGGLKGVTICWSQNKKCYASIEECKLKCPPC